MEVRVAVLWDEGGDRGGARGGARGGGWLWGNLMESETGCGAHESP